MPESAPSESAPPADRRWPALAVGGAASVQPIARHDHDSRPVITPEQQFTLGHAPANVVGTVGTVATVGAAGADGEAPRNWQITGGTGTGKFAINPDTGRITIPDPRQLELTYRIRYTLTVTTDGRQLTSQPEIVTITVPDQINICHHGRTVAIPRNETAVHLQHGDAIGQLGP